MDEENKVEAEAVEVATDAVAVESSDNGTEEGAPVGAATIVEDTPVEQFPAHDETSTSQ